MRGPTGGAEAPIASDTRRSVAGEASVTSFRAPSATRLAGAERHEARHAAVVPGHEHQRVANPAVFEACILFPYSSEPVTSFFTAKHGPPETTDVCKCATSSPPMAFDASGRCRIRGEAAPIAVELFCQHAIPHRAHQVPDFSRKLLMSQHTHRNKQFQCIIILDRVDATDAREPRPQDEPLEYESSMQLVPD